MSDIERRRVVAGGALGLGAALTAGLAGAPAAAAAVTEPIPGLAPFDSSFGTFAALNTWLAQQSSSAQRVEVKFGTHSYTLDAPISLRSGNRLVGTFAPSREFRTGTVFTSGSQPSFFHMTVNSQGYPSDGSVRDFTVQGICFYGNAPLLPNYKVNTDTYRAHTEWYTELRDCAYVGAGPVVSGWGDGLHLTGTWHIQAVNQTCIRLGGSENSLFMDNGISFIDSEAMNGTGQPFIDIFSDMWSLGSVMISARGNSYQLKVSGGGNGRVSGTYFDAPSSVRTALPQLQLTGGRSLSVTNSSFHNGTGGAIQCSSGSAQMVVAGNVFNDNPGALLTCQPGFTGVVKWDSNAYAGSTPRTIRVANLNQVIVNDPQVTITDLSGNTLRAATR